MAVVTRREQQGIRRRAIKAAHQSVAAGGCTGNTPGLNAKMTQAQWAAYWSPRQVAARQKAARIAARKSATSAASFAAFAKSAGFTPAPFTRHAPLWWSTYYATISAACTARPSAGSKAPGISQSPALRARAAFPALRPARAAPPARAARAAKASKAK